MQCLIPEKGRRKGKQSVILLPRFPTVAKAYESHGHLLCNAAERMPYILHSFLDGDYEIQNYSPLRVSER